MSLLQFALLLVFSAHSAQLSAWQVDLSTYADKAVITDAVQFQHLPGWQNSDNYVYTVQPGDDVTLPCWLSIMVSGTQVQVLWTLLDTDTRISIGRDIVVLQTTNRYSIAVQMDNIQQQYLLKIANVQSDVVGLYQCSARYNNVSSMIIFRVQLNDSGNIIAPPISISSPIVATYPSLPCCTALKVGPRCLPGCIPNLVTFMYTNAFTYETLCSVSEMNAIVACLAPKVGSVLRCCQLRGVDRRCLRFCSTNQVGQSPSSGSAFWTYPPPQNATLSPTAFSPPLFTADDGAVCGNSFETIMQCYTVPDLKLPSTPALNSVDLITSNGPAANQIEVHFSHPAPSYSQPSVAMSYQDSILYSTIAKSFTVLSQNSTNNGSVPVLVATTPNWSQFGAAAGRDGAEFSDSQAQLLGFNLYWSADPMSEIFNAITLPSSERAYTFNVGYFTSLTVFIDAINANGFSYPSAHIRLLNDFISQPAPSSVSSSASASNALFSRCIANSVPADCAALLCSYNQSFGGNNSITIFSPSAAALFSAPSQYAAAVSAGTPVTMTPPFNGIGNLLSVIDTVAAARCVSAWPGVLNSLSAGGQNVTPCCMANDVPKACLRACNGAWQIYSVADIGCFYSLPAISRCYQRAVLSSGVPRAPRQLSLVSRFLLTPKNAVYNLKTPLESNNITWPYESLLPSNASGYQWFSTPGSADYRQNYAYTVACTVSWLPPSGNTGSADAVVNYLVTATVVVEFANSTQSNQLNYATSSTYTFVVPATYSNGSQEPINVTLLLPRGQFFDVQVVARSSVAQSASSNHLRFYAMAEPIAFASLLKPVVTSYSFTPAPTGVVVSYQPSVCCAVANVSASCQPLCRVYGAAISDPMLATRCISELPVIFSCLSANNSALRCCVDRSAPARFNAMCTGGVMTPLALDMQDQIVPRLGATWSWKAAVAEAVSVPNSLMNVYLFTLRLCFSSNFGALPDAPEVGVQTPIGPNSLLIRWLPAPASMPFLVNTTGLAPIGVNQTAFQLLNLTDSFLKPVYYVRVHNYMADIISALANNGTLPTYITMPTTTGLSATVPGLLPNTRYIVQVAVEMYNVFTGSRVRGFTSRPIYVVTDAIMSTNGSSNDWPVAYNQTASCAVQYIGVSLCDPLFLIQFSASNSLVSELSASNFSVFQQVCTAGRDATKCCVKRQIPDVCLPLCNGTSTLSSSASFADCAPFLCAIQTCVAGDTESASASLYLPNVPSASIASLNSSVALITYASDSALTTSNGVFTGEASPGETLPDVRHSLPVYNTTGNGTMYDANNQSVTLYVCYTSLNNNSLVTSSGWHCDVLPANSNDYRLGGLLPAATYAAFTVAVGQFGASEPTPITTFNLPPPEYDLPLVQQYPPGVLALGSNVTLRCFAPWNSVISWSFNGVSLPPTGGANAAISISNVSLAHAGTYTCVITSFVDYDCLVPPSSSIWAASAALRVLAFPTVSVPRPIVLASQYDTVNLACVFGGHVTDVEWRRGNLSSALPGWSMNYVPYLTGYAADPLSYAELRIVNVSYSLLSDAGSPFTCIGRNALGSVSAVVTLLSSVSALYANATRFDVSPYVDASTSKANVRTCCNAMNVNSACLPVCAIASIDMSFGTVGNCLRSYPALLQCASAADTIVTDHSSCCKNSGVPFNCMPACRGIPLNAQDPGVLNCYSSAAAIFRCLSESLSSAPPNAPAGLRISSISSAGAIAVWNTPVNASTIAVYLLSVTCLTCAQSMVSAKPYHANLPMTAPPELFDQSISVFRVARATGTLLPATSYTISLSNLTLGMNYSVAVYALVHNFVSPASVPFNFTAGYLPDRPPGGAPTINPSSFTDCTVSWTAVPYDSVAPVLYYTVYASVGSSKSRRKRQVPAQTANATASYRVSPDVTVYTLTCLQPLTQYSTWVTASNTFGESAPGVASMFITGSLVDPSCPEMSANTTPQANDAIAVGLTVVICVISVLIVLVIVASLVWVMRLKIRKCISSLSRRVDSAIHQRAFNHQRFSDSNSVSSVRLEDRPTAMTNGAASASASASNPATVTSEPHSQQRSLAIRSSVQARPNVESFSNVAYDTDNAEVSFNESPNWKVDVINRNADNTSPVATNTNGHVKESEPESPPVQLPPTPPTTEDLNADADVDANANADADADEMVAEPPNFDHSDATFA